jgi:hypothetical protein
MRRTFALVAGALLCSGCTPNAMIEFLYPTCKQEHTSCEDEKRNHTRNLDPPWKTDTSHWSGHFRNADTIGVHFPRLPRVDTIVVPDTIYPQSNSDSPRR